MPCQCVRGWSIVHTDPTSQPCRVRSASGAAVSWQLTASASATKAGCPADDKLYNDQVTGKLCGLLGILTRDLHRQ